MKLYVYSAIFRLGREERFSEILVKINEKVVNFFHILVVNFLICLFMIKIVEKIYCNIHNLDKKKFTKEFFSNESVIYSLLLRYLGV